MSSSRFSHLAIGALAFAAVVLVASTTWAVFEGLGPSKDDWGMKYEVDVNVAGDKLNVAFTLEDAGRLKPIHSVLVVAFSAPDNNGARRWDLKSPIQLTATTDGKRAGEVQIPKEFANRALIRIMTQTVDGRRVKGVSAAYYEIPLKKFLKAPGVAAVKG